jgi:single-strand DNA-binding protein
MKSMNNNVNLIGNLGQDVNMITFKTGNKKASVSLATSSFYKNAKGELQKETQWHNLIAWGLQAEMMSKALRKGSMIAVKGSLQYRDFQDKAGKDIKVTEVVVEDFIVVQKRKSENAKSENLFEEVAEAPLPF